VQVIMRRTTLLSEHQFVSAAATQAAVSQLLAHSLAATVAKQMDQSPETPEGSGGNSLSNSGLSPVQRAMESRDLDELAKELEGGAHFEVEWRNAWRQSVLHLLAAAGRAALCRLVLTLGAKV
jgi:hypothetical protein